jgi:hypothetical protein
MNNLPPDPATGGVMHTPEAVLYGPEELATLRAEAHRLEAEEVAA